MTKRKGIFDVSMPTDKLKPKKKETIAKGMEIEKALSIIERQMKLNVNEH